MHAVVLAQASAADPILAIGGFVGLIALILKAVDFVRLFANIKTNVSAVVTQVLAWVGGIVAVVLFSSSDFGNSVNAAGTTLDKVSGATLVLLGIMLSSAASVVVDIKQSIDSTDSAAKPPIIK